MGHWIEERTPGAWSMEQALLGFVQMNMAHNGTCLGQALFKVCVTIRTYMTDFIYFTQCTDTGVIATHALSFYQPMAPLFLLTHAQLAVVTQSCALLYTAAHCDLLLQ